MAKNTCALCGVDVNIFTSQKLTDGNYICRKSCLKKGLSVFNYANASLSMVQAHFEQVEYGTKVWNQIFVPRLKTKEKNEKLTMFGIGNEIIYVSEATGLMALEENRYSFMFFGKTTVACVYRIADLYGYELEEETKKVNDNDETHYYAHLFFGNVEGLTDFRVEMRDGEFPCLEKYFNKLFGIQKTLSNIGNTWKNQMNAAKAFGAALEAVKNGGDDLLDKAADAEVALDTAQYGDRTQLIARADAALASVRS